MTALLLSSPEYPVWFERLKGAVVYDNAPLVSKYLASDSVRAGDEDALLRFAFKESSERVLQYLLNTTDSDVWREIFFKTPAAEFIRDCYNIRMLDMTLKKYCEKGIDVSGHLVEAAQLHIGEQQHESGKQENAVLLLIRYGLDTSALKLQDNGSLFFYATIGCQQPLSQWYNDRLRQYAVHDYETYVRIGKRIARKKDVELPLTVPERIDARRMHLRRSCKNLADILISLHLLPALQTLLIVQHSCQLYHLLDEYVMYSKIVAVKNKAANKASV